MAGITCNAVFIIVLLRYDSQTLQFSYLKCAVQYIHSCAAVAETSFGTVLSLEKTFYRLTVIPEPPTSPSPVNY